MSSPHPESVAPPEDAADQAPAPESEREDPTELERLVQWLDTRTGAAAIARVALRKVFPDHWTFLLGEVALFCFVVLVATGTYLTFFYHADSLPTIYQGPYPSLAGAQVSDAFNSVMHLSFEVRAGLLMRQTHHWAALIFVAAIAVHLARIFFTGAFRRPREINWMIGSGLLLLALGEGFTGYSLPDDLLSGTGLRIFYSAILSIPFIGPWAASLVFGGAFPSNAVISRLFVLHVMLLPGLLIGGIAAHLLLVYIQKHTQYKGPRATEGNVIGLPFWPAQVFRSLGLFFLTAAVIVAIGGLIQINPVWTYGPFLPYAVSSPAQPDWYIGWLEGSLRIGLPFEPTILGVTIPEPFIPGMLLPGIVIGGLVIWPFIEAWIAHDHAEHHLLDWWWERPFRTATGVAFVMLFLLTTLAGGNDVLAVFLNVPVEALTVLFRVAVVLVPVGTWLFVFWFARRRGRGGEQVAHHPAGVRLRRTGTGGFEEVES